MTAWKETRARETRDERCELARCGGPGSSSSPPPRSRWPLAAWRWIEWIRVQGLEAAKNAGVSQ